MAVEGAVLISGNQWLQGKGEHVYSNGGNLSTKWQCVELPQQRLYPNKGWPRVFAQTGGAVSIPEGSPGLTRYNPGSKYIPVPGDLVIEYGTSWNQYGHVSVVDYTDTAKGIIYAVEQNGSANGRVTYLYNGSNYTSAGRSVKCILHAPNNNFKNPGSTESGVAESPNVPVVGDWDGNKTTTIGLYRQNTARFFLKNSNSTGKAEYEFQFGDPAGCIPIAGDWNGTGKDTIGFYNPKTAKFYLKNSLAGGKADYEFQFGDPAGCIPIAGDWNGTGKDTIGFYNPKTAKFYLKNSLAGGKADYEFQFGDPAGCIPVAGDWNGTGKDTIGFYNPKTAKFYLKNSLAGGKADIEFQFGDPKGFYPIVGDWNGDGKDTVGLYKGDTGQTYLKNENSLGVANLSFQFGG